LSLVLDASVAVHWFLSDEGDRNAALLLERAVLRVPTYPRCFGGRVKAGFFAQSARGGSPAKRSMPLWK